jgi:hypothetical protein
VKGVAVNNFLLAGRFYLHFTRAVGNSGGCILFMPTGKKNEHTKKTDCENRKAIRVHNGVVAVVVS